MKPRLRDLPRLLHSRSEYGYTSRPSEAMSTEPEAVPADYQAQLSQRARRTAVEQAAGERRDAQAQLVAALDAYAALQLSPRDKSTLRAMRRQAANLWKNT